MVALLVFLGLEFLLWGWLTWIGYRVAASVPLSPMGLEPRGWPASPPLPRQRVWGDVLQPDPRWGTCTTPVVSGTPEEIIKTVLAQTANQRSK